jgi:hypothetical protein
MPEQLVALSSDCPRLVARAAMPMHPGRPPALGPPCTVSLSPLTTAALENAWRDIAKNHCFHPPRYRMYSAPAI